MKKYCLNTGTKILHITGKCYYSCGNFNMEYFDTIDEVIAEKQRYFAYCKNCFKEDKKSK